MTTTSTKRATLDGNDHLVLGLWAVMATIGLGAQTAFFGMAAKQFGLWMPVSVVTGCGIIILGVCTVLLTPLVRRCIRHVRFAERWDGACLVSGCSHDCRA